MKTCTFWLCVLTVLAVEAELQAADALQPSTQWEGSMKNDKGSVNARLLVKERKGIDLTGELWWDNDTRGIALAGTVSETGIVVLKVTKELKGTGFKDLIDNARFRGTLSGKNFKANWAVPGANARVGELSLKLKE